MKLLFFLWKDTFPSVLTVIDDTFLKGVIDSCAESMTEICGDILDGTIA